MAKGRGSDERGPHCRCLHRSRWQDCADASLARPGGSTQGRWAFASALPAPFCSPKPLSKLAAGVRFSRRLADATCDRLKNQVYHAICLLTRLIVQFLAIPLSLSGSFQMTSWALDRLDSC